MRKDCSYSAVFAYQVVGGRGGGFKNSNDYKKPGFHLHGFCSFGEFIYRFFLSERRPFRALGLRTDDPRHRVRFSTVISRTRKGHPPERWVEKSFFWILDCFIQHCLIRRPSDSTVSEDVGIDWDFGNGKSNALTIRLDLIPHSTSTSHPLDQISSQHS